MISSYIHLFFFANSPISFFFRAAKNSHFSLSICLLLDLQAHSITWQMQMWNFSWGCLFSLLWVWTQTWSLKPNSGSLFSFLLRPPFWLPQRWNRLHCPWQCVRSYILTCICCYLLSEWRLFLLGQDRISVLLSLMEKGGSLLYVCWLFVLSNWRTSCSFN